MELQLGLALPTNPPKLVDLNSRAYEANFNHNKRSFSQLFDHAPPDQSTNHAVLPTLPLLPLTPAAQPNDYEEHSSTHCSIITNKNDGDDEDALVGWPPLNYRRKKIRSNNHGDHDDDDAGNNHIVWIDDHDHDHGCGGMKGSNTYLYVKVKMEGVGIARKVDLSMHHSFQTLKDTLMDMFGKCHQQDSNSYELAYQDKEGDWLVAEDVPWRSFIQCAQRLKLLKSRG